MVKDVQELNDLMRQESLLYPRYFAKAEQAERDGKVGLAVRNWYLAVGQAMTRHQEFEARSRLDQCLGNNPQYKVR